MTDRELMQQALDALDILNGAETVDGIIVYTDQEIEALRTALAQPKKEWVGLTDEEIDAVSLANGFRRGSIRFSQAINVVEAKLKEKND